MKNTKTEKLVSVIVPAYNVAEYIEKCIESIIAQTYQCLEIILVDDGSTDDTGKICDHYAEQDDRIRVIHKINGGLSDARNVALNVAAGDYISFVDGDDWIHSQMFELMVNTMLNREVDIVTCMYSRDEGDIKENYDISYIDVDILSGTEAFSDPGRVLVISCCKLFSKKIFDNIRYPKNKYHEDEFVFHRIIHNAKHVAVIDKPLYYYTVRDGSITSYMTPKRVDDALEAFEDRISYTRRVNWKEAIPIAISQYCDHCINEYFNLKRGKYPELDDSYKTIFLEHERNILQQNADVKIWKGYKIFAKSPSFYFVWLNSRKRLAECLKGR